MPLVRFYLHCESAWRTGLGGREGLMYSECRVVYDALGQRLKLPRWSRALDALQQIEHSVLAAQAERHAAAAPPEPEPEPWRKR